ncbi:hypothetical protein HMPREF9404_5038 [Eggerthella sp. HGA1]|nr:hypothetical protein HMPREF9404_5038 [Eggerthella sp. HGA1]
MAGLSIRATPSSHAAAAGRRSLPFYPLCMIIHATRSLPGKIAFGIYGAANTALYF